MKPTRNQVERSLAALANEPGPGHRPTNPPRDAVADAIKALPAGLLASIEETIDIRPDRLDQARAHLAHLDELTADELADRIVGRLVCDRLR